MSLWKNTALASLLAAGLGLGAAALAADPLISVPSTPDAAGKVMVRGKDVAPLTNVTVRFENAQASPISLVVQTTSNGSFVLPFAPPIPGAYKVSVYDSAGRLIGQGNFGVIR